MYTNVQCSCDFFTTLKVKFKRLEVQACQAYGILTEPDRQKRHNVAKNLGETAVFKMCRTVLSQLSLKLQKLALLQKISLDVRSVRKQVKELAFFLFTSTSHSN